MLSYNSEVWVASSCRTVFEVDTNAANMIMGASSGQGLSVSIALVVVLAFFNGHDVFQELELEIYKSTNNAEFWQRIA